MDEVFVKNKHQLVFQNATRLYFNNIPPDKKDTDSNWRQYQQGSKDFKYRPHYHLSPPQTLAIVTVNTKPQY